MTTMVVSGLEGEIPVHELRARVEELGLRSGLQFCTMMNALVLGRKLHDEHLANFVNLPLLAKGVVLWSRVVGGRDIRMTKGSDDERQWLLRAFNSLPWYDRPAGKPDRDEAVMGMLVRQAFMRTATSHRLIPRVARNWMMFHELVKEGGLPVADPSAELRNALGVSAEDLWTLGMAIRSFYTSVTANNANDWVFRPETLIQEGPNRSAVETMLRQAFKTISLTPEQLRERYSENGSKYRNHESTDSSWVTEFNILRDFPIVSLGDGSFCAPHPAFALTRAIDGFYFDLVEVFARRAQQSGRGGNFYDNEMTQTLGTLYQRYVGRQLRLLHANDNELLPEFKYGPKLQKDSPDWILARSGRVPVLFECKARQATLDVQRYATPQQLRNEIEAAIGKACRQLVRFICAIDKKERGLERFFGQDQFVCAVVLHSPLPYHMIPDIREVIEAVAEEMEPLWKTHRNRLLFVPMSVDELETAVAAELVCGTPIEKQLADYALYRNNAQRVERWENNLPVFPMHFGEYVESTYCGGQSLENPLCREVWGRFRDYCFCRLFGEQAVLKDDSAVRRLAYGLWEERGRPLGDDQRDWYEAERRLLGE